MRKISLVLLICISIIAVSLTSCDVELPFELPFDLPFNTGSDRETEHTHTFSEEWANDETHHWYVCTSELCFEVTEKSEHAWNEGESVEDTVVYTCTLCGATKNERCETSTNDGKWEQMQDYFIGDNVTMHLTGAFKEDSADGESFDTTVKLNENICSIEEDGYKDIEDDPETIQFVKDIYFNTVKSIVSDYANFEYNSKENLFYGKGEIVYFVSYMGKEIKITSTNVVVEMDSSSQLIKLTCDMRQESEAMNLLLILNVTFEFSDYGTTVIEIPTE